MQSSACLSGHTIQHREKPFIQHSLPNPPSKLPSNSVRPEWTRWHGSTALPLSTPPPPHTFSALSRTLFVLHSFLHFFILSILLSSLNIQAFPFSCFLPCSSLSWFPTLLSVICVTRTRLYNAVPSPLPLYNISIVTITLLQGS